MQKKGWSRLVILQDSLESSIAITIMRSIIHFKPVEPCLADDLWLIAEKRCSIFFKNTINTIKFKIRWWLESDSLLRCNNISLKGSRFYCLVSVQHIWSSVFKSSHAEEVINGTSLINVNISIILSKIKLVLD